MSLLLVQSISLLVVQLVIYNNAREKCLLNDNRGILFTIFQLH